MPDPATNAAVPRTDPVDPRAQQTVAKVERALQRSDTAAIAQVVAVISDLARKAHSISIQELADLINKDIAILTKVLAAANTMAFNPWGVEVTTVSQAIQVVGLNKIRDLAIALMLMEKSEARLSASEQREVAAIALSSGLVAQSVAGRIPGQETEMAFVCASLRNYGRLLMATFLRAEYRDARALAAEMDSDDAYRQVFGITPLELSYQLLVSNNLPESILKCLKEVPPEVIHGAVRSPDQQLLVLSEFAVKLCEAIDGAHTGGADTEGRIAQVFRRYGRSLAVKRDDLATILQEVEAQLTSLGRICGIDSFRCTLTTRLVAIASGRNPDDAFAPAATPRESHARPQAPPGEVSNPQARRPLRQGHAAVDEAHRPPAPGSEPHVPDPAALPRGVSALSQLMAGSSFTFAASLDIAVRAIRSGLGLEQVLYFVREDTPAGNRFIAHHGIGPLLNEVRRKPLLDPRQRDVFAVSLSRGEDVVIQNLGAAQLKPFVPAWLRAHVTTHGLVLLPLKAGDQVTGLVLGLGYPEQPIAISHATVQQLKVLRASCAVARELAGPTMASAR